jgi:hypothetical protein
VLAPIHYNGLMVSVEDEMPVLQDQDDYLGGLNYFVCRSVCTKISVRYNMYSPV